jgi:hypothetical protein
MKTKERESKVVDVFKHRGRTCVIVSIEWNPNILARTKCITNYHNGYVSVAPRHKGLDYVEVAKRIEADELTYAGTLDTLDDDRISKTMWFLGFDSAHFWNDLKPKSKTFESVRKRTIKIADEMIRKGI